MTFKSIKTLLTLSLSLILVHQISALPTTATLTTTNNATLREYADKLDMYIGAAGNYKYLNET